MHILHLKSWDVLCKSFICLVIELGASFFSNIYISAFQHLPLRSAVQPHDKNQLQTKVVSLHLQKCNFRSFAISCLSNLYVHMAAILGKSRSSANYVT